MSIIFKKNRLFSGKNRSPDDFCKWLCRLSVAVAFLILLHSAFGSAQFYQLVLDTPHEIFPNPAFR